MRVSFALISCLFASTISPLFTGCGDDGEDPDEGSETGGQAGSGPTNTGGRVTTGGRGGGTGGGGGVSDGGEPSASGGTTGGRSPIPLGGSAGEAGRVAPARASAPAAAAARTPVRRTRVRTAPTAYVKATSRCAPVPPATRASSATSTSTNASTTTAAAGPPRCVNTPGSFKCGDCDQGYVKDENGDCVDIDECEVLTEALRSPHRLHEYGGRLYVLDLSRRTGRRSEERLHRSQRVSQRPVR